MKKRLAVLLAAILLLSFSACANNASNMNESSKSDKNSSILVAYDPAAQDIVHAAEIIADTVSGDLVEIGNNSNLQTAQYEFVLLGFSAQDNTLPASVQDFLENYDFGARTLYPFVIGKNNTQSGIFAALSHAEPGALLGGSVLIINGQTAHDAIVNWANSLSLTEAQALPQDERGNTVATASVTPQEQQVLYLWEEDNVPAQTEYTENNGGYFDDPNFRPYITSFPVPEGVEVKGAVLICAGGAFQFRSDQNEGTPVAEAMSRLGYQSFVLDYRLRPYTQQEGALDLARAVRFVRAHAADYDIDPQDIAVMGFSAGGILSGEMLLHFDGNTLPTVLDPDYRPDTLDEVSADAAACGMIYSFYGRLSVGTTDVELLRSGSLPPTFYCYGTRDPFYEQFLANADAAEEAGVPVERLQLDGYPHGFGADGDWIPAYDQWLSGVFAEN